MFTRRGIALAAFVAVAATAEASVVGDNESIHCTGIQTLGSFCRGKSEFQPLVGVKIDKTAHYTLWRLRARLSDGTDPASISDYKIYKTSGPAFADATDMWSGLKKTFSSTSRDIEFDFWQGGDGQSTLPSVKAGDYLWVGARVKATARAGAEIDAKVTAVHINGFVSYIDNEDPAGAGVVYPYAYHVVPYWRLNTWTLAGLVPQHRGLYTEIIAFEVGVNADGSVRGGWHDNRNLTQAEVKERIAQIRSKAGSGTKVLMGVGHCAGQLAAVSADASLRVAAAKNLTAWVEAVGADGIDIDWEYPTTAEHWRGWAALMSELKPRLFALGGGKMASIAITGAKMSEAQNLGAGAALRSLVQQCDFVSTMSYDSFSSDGHAPMWLMQNDVAKLKNLGVPAHRICAGQAFYTNNYPVDWVQRGFNWVVNNYPQYVDSTDIFTADDGTRVTYNSLDTIRKKARWCRENGCGVMIWANETDVRPTHVKSATRALMQQVGPRHFGGSRASWKNPVTGEEAGFACAFDWLNGPWWGNTGNWQAVGDEGGLGPFTGSSAPCLAGSDYLPAVFDGEFLFYRDARNVGTGADALMEGWKLKVGCFNGARVTIEKLHKLQGGCWFMVDAASQLRIGAKTAKNGVVGVQDGTVDLHVAAKDGVVFTTPFPFATGGSSNTLTYSFAGEGSVLYSAGVFSGAHRIAYVRIPAAGARSAVRKLYRRQIVSFGSSTSGNIAFDTGGAVVESEGGALSMAKFAGEGGLGPEAAPGTYRLEQTSDGVYVEYVGYAHPFALILR